MRIVRHHPGRETEQLTLTPNSPAEKALLASLPPHMRLMEVAVTETSNGRVTSKRGGKCLPDDLGDNILITLRMQPRPLH